LELEYRVGIWSWITIGLRRFSKEKGQRLNSMGHFGADSERSDQNKIKLKNLLERMTIE